MVLRILVLLFVCGWRQGAQACASLSDEPVRVSQESAIIVWDEAHHKQHFIRRASFETKSRDVGFLVPTPSTPELAEADDAAFSQMSELMKPEKIEKIDRIWELSIFSRRISNTFNAASASLNDGAVTVIFQQHVAGYDAAVLEASDGAALGRWLQAHGYSSSPALLKWLEPYIQKRWKITAFKIPKANKNSTEISSTAVRMSFDTPRPFFPYSEPQTKQSQSKAPRWLQIFFFAPKRMEGFRNVAMRKIWWGGPTEWANLLPVAKQSGFAKQLHLPDENFAKPQWLTVISDRSPRRNATSDVFFAPDTKQESVLPFPVTIWKKQYIFLPLDLIFVVGGLLFWVIYSFVYTKRVAADKKNQRIE